MIRNVSIWYGFGYGQIIGNSSSNREECGIRNFNDRDLLFTSPK
jgi:hypothetical protein